MKYHDHKLANLKEVIAVITLSIAINKGYLSTVSEGQVEKSV